MSILDGKKTELEKRWEEEEEEEKVQDCSESCRCATPCESEKGSCEDGEEIDIVWSPLAQVDVPLVLILCNNRLFLGGLLGIREDGVVIDHPMVYLEIPDPQNQGRLQVGVQKIFHGLPVPDNMVFKYDALNMLKTGDRTLALARLYEKTYKEIKAAECGLSVPTMNDITKLNRKNG